MPVEKFENFAGLFTEGDEFSERGSKDSINIDINLANNLENAKGFEYIQPNSIECTAFSFSENCLQLNIADHGLSVGDCIFLYSPDNDELNSKCSGRLWKVQVSNSASFEVMGIEEASEDGTLIIDKSLTKLSLQIFGDMGLINGSKQEYINHYGSISFGNEIYSFIGVNDYNYLCKTDTAQINWEFAEKGVSPTPFSSYHASFVIDSGYIIFAKSEEKTIDSLSGGVFYLKVTSSTDVTIQHYGTATNNPTPKILTKFRERIWAGNIVNELRGGSWVMVSKQFPSPEDNTTWSPSTTKYNDGATGAGLFRCDDNYDDEIVNLIPSMGVLTILRQYRPYIFTGAISTGNVSLARAIDTEYGAISPFVAVSSRGLWFISQYGLSKIEGVTVDTVATELDNITTITFDEKVKSLFSTIPNKEKIILHIEDYRLWVHDPTNSRTYVLNLVNNEWTMHSSKPIENIVKIKSDSFGMKRGMVFKLDTGYSIFDINTMRKCTQISTYRSMFRDQGTPLKQKEYMMGYVLAKGTITDQEEAILHVDIFMNGNRNEVVNTISVDLKTGNILSWNEVTINGTLTWDELTQEGNITWDEALGKKTEEMIEVKKYFIGTGYSIQIRLRYEGTSQFMLSKIYFDYQIID